MRVLALPWLLVLRWNPSTYSPTYNDRTIAVDVGLTVQVLGFFKLHDTKKEFKDRREGEGLFMSPCFASTANRHITARGSALRRQRRWLLQSHNMSATTLQNLISKTSPAAETRCPPQQPICPSSLRLFSAFRAWSERQSKNEG